MSERYLPIYGPHDGLFKGTIKHPDLWLWDSWTSRDGDNLHLYCLALNKQEPDGTPIAPCARNNYGFHIRHFKSPDAGNTWRDLGACITPGQNKDDMDRHNVWSGSVLKLRNGQVAYGYTGIKAPDNNHAFIQNICVAIGDDFDGPDLATATCLISPEADYDTIIEAGFYLAPREALGANAGEEGGPILGWRDPFLFYDLDDQLYAVWSAKIAPSKSALAFATLKETQHGSLEIDTLLPPVHLPDADRYTQAEVPKVYYDQKAKCYALLISSCDRLFEGQPDSEVTHALHLYRGPKPTGPWSLIGRLGDYEPAVGHYFGASIIDLDLDAGHIELLGPYTENAGHEAMLSFGPVATVTIKE